MHRWNPVSRDEVGDFSIDGEDRELAGRIFDYLKAAGAIKPGYISRNLNEPLDDIKRVLWTFHESIFRRNGMGEWSIKLVREEL